MGSRTLSLEFFLRPVLLVLLLLLPPLQSPMRNSSDDEKRAGVDATANSQLCSATSLFPSSRFHRLGNIPYSLFEVRSAIEVTGIGIVVEFRSMSSPVFLSCLGGLGPGFPVGLLLGVQFRVGAEAGNDGLQRAGSTLAGPTDKQERLLVGTSRSTSNMPSDPTSASLQDAGGRLLELPSATDVMATVFCERACFVFAVKEPAGTRTW